MRWGILHQESGRAFKRERQDAAIISTQQPAETAVTAEPDISPELSNRRAWAVTCFAINFLYAVYLGSIGVLLEVIGKRYGMGAAAQARLFPASFVGMGVGVLLCGWLSDRIGRKKVLLGSAAGYALGLILFAASPLFSLALMSAALIGAGSGAMQTVANALASELFPARRAAMINATQIAFGTGAACGPFAAHYFLSNGIDWRLLYCGLAGLIALLFLAAACLPAFRSAFPSPTMDFAAVRSIVRQPAFLGLCIAAALYAGAEVGFFQWMPSYFHLRLRDGERWAGLVISLFWIGMICGRLAAAGYIHRFVLTRLRSILSAAGGLCAIGAVLFPAPLPTLVFVALTGLCFGGIFSIILSETGERFPGVAGTAFGGVVAMAGIGTALIPWVIGALAVTPLDWRGALCLVPLCAFGVVINAAWMGRQAG